MAWDVDPNWLFLAYSIMSKGGESFLSPLIAVEFPREVIRPAMDERYLPSLDPRKGEWDEEAISRRRLLEVGFWAAAGTAGMIIGGAGVRFWVGNALKPRPEQWVEVGSIADLPPGKMHRASFRVHVADAWRETQEAGVLYAFTEDGEHYTVLHASCTHLGCNVHWQEEAGYFACPCHDGRFTRSGEVISGPPPKPLRRLQTKIENGILLALV